MNGIARSHLNGLGKTRSHHFLMDYAGIRTETSLIDGQP